MGILTRKLWPVLLLCVFPVPEAGAAGDLTLREQEIKAGLLYNFLKYTRWPDSSFSTSPSITVCIFGGDPFGGSLTPMEGRTVNQRAIALRQVREPEALEGCHLLFINAAAKKRWPELHRRLSGRNVLTVSDFAAFAASGGMIEFSRRGGHIGAKLNVEAVNAAGLHIEERLLRLVTVMTSTPQGVKP